MITKFVFKVNVAKRNIYVNDFDYPMDGWATILSGELTVPDYLYNLALAKGIDADQITMWFLEGALMQHLGVQVPNCERPKLDAMREGAQQMWCKQENIDWATYEPTIRFPFGPQGYGVNSEI